MSVATTISTGQVFLPGAEFVRVTFTSGDTYQSKKFRKIIGAVSSGIMSSTTTADVLNLSIGTSDTSTLTLTAGTAATSLSTCLMVWGIR